MNEKIKASGEVEIKIVRADGSIELDVIDNLIVTVGRAHIADQLADKGEAVMSHMAIGTGTNTQVIGDTALQTELNRKAFTSKVQGSGADANKIIFITNWPAGEGTGAITEAGIFNASSAGVLLARTTFSVKNKGASDSLSIQWTVSITG